MRIPRTALVLTWAGVLPFILGAMIACGNIAAHMGEPGEASSYPLITASDGQDVLISYGVIILAFMTGILWGFATRSENPVYYALSVVPALWAFFTTGGNVFVAGHAPQAALVNLMIGFAGLVLLELLYVRAGLTPPWWMRLRLPITAVVLTCLAIGSLA